MGHEVIPGKAMSEHPYLAQARPLRPLRLMVPLHCIGTAACLYAQVRPENCSLRGLYLMELPSYLMHGNAPLKKTVLLLPHFQYLDLYLCIVQCTASRRAWL